MEKKIIITGKELKDAKVSGFGEYVGRGFSSLQLELINGKLVNLKIKNTKYGAIMITTTNI